MLNPETIRTDFPIFAQHPDLIYLDSAATALKPHAVIEKEREYMMDYPANIARGLYPLATKATQEYEQTRDTSAQWIGAKREEIIFTKGTTESINLLAHTLEHRIDTGDTIVVTAMDHHANFLPWQALALRTGAHFRIVPVTEDGSLDENAFASIIDHRTKIFAFPHISNVLATVNDAPSLTQKVRALAPHALIILDAAQSAPNRTLDVTQLGVDFVAFSAHKCFGPTGVGILWGKYDLLDTLPPFLFGGDMVERAGEHESLFKHPPYRFEAGTSNISGIIAFRSAIDYIKDLGMDEIQAHEQRLSTYAIEKLRAHFPDIHILGSDDTQHRGGIISFILPGIHPHDLAEFLGSKDMCIRAGLHCAHPLHTSLQLSASARMSFSIYTSTQDIDRTIEAMHEAHKRYV